MSWNEAGLLNCKTINKSTTIVLVWPLLPNTLLPDMKKELVIYAWHLLQECEVFSPPPLSLDHKTVAHLILRAEPPHLPTCIPHKCPILINLFLAYHFASGWILSELSPDTSEWFSLKNHGCKPQSGFWLGSSQRCFGFHAASLQRGFCYRLWVCLPSLWSVLHSTLDLFWSSRCGSVVNESN